MLLRSLTAGVALACLSACSSGSAAEPADTDASNTPSKLKSLDAHEALPVGASGPLTVYAHCGFEFTNIDGELWRTRPRDDGQGNPPAGWTEAVEGTIERTSETRAVFTGSSVRVRAVFRPAPKATYVCQ